MPIEIRAAPPTHGRAAAAAATASASSVPFAELYVGAARDENGRSRQPAADRGEVRRQRAVDLDVRVPARPHARSQIVQTPATNARFLTVPAASNKVAQPPGGVAERSIAPVLKTGDG